MLLNTLTTNPLQFVIIAAALVLSLTVHEFAHAWTADRLGDPTPRRYGRVTLNPAKHLDPFGTLLLLFASFGFARPVPINPNNLGRWGTLWVAAAGPISNIFLALLCVLLLNFVAGIPFLAAVLVQTLITNIVLAVFNLLPIPLLDGSRIVGSLFPSLGRSLAQYEALPYGFLITFGFILLMREPINSLITRVLFWLDRTFSLPF